MSKSHAKCSVVGCTKEHKTLHRVPAEEDRRAAWIEFIFDGNIPATVGKKLFVCANHFETDCFANYVQYKAELAGKLVLNDGAVPTLREIPADEEHASTSLMLHTEERPATKDIGCQTEPPERKSVGTQLSSRTLHSHHKSEAVQATVSCKDFGTSTDPWTAASSKTGPERVAKWTSLLNHVQNVHTHEDPIFPKCLHTIRKTRDKRTPAFYHLEKELTKKTVLKDIAKLSPHYQTSSLEAFHSVILRFAPKNVVYPYLGMLCRLYLAALHYNENAN
ncbi:uncharacterized protein LOC121699817 isoform X2 [Alosa sapidissima]|uniref:uncharacterized protein LOC121699817 isoform X2 n=1 Tax=Alosa sapidissima TaxID=34773 RepID=UPI001C0A20AC|nr:uncharacterized protein LOC121699817 isoform X2 [Alosa sapidissima]